MLLMKQTLNAVMAYEETSTAERAKEMCDHLACTLKGHYGSGLRLWKFDLLRIPELRDVAATDAAGADMILIATHGDGELPTEVKAWIDGWLVEKRKMYERQSTLAALFDALPKTVGIPALAQFAYLQRVARKGNMDFLVSTFDPPGGSIVFSHFQNAPRDRAAPGRVVILKERHGP
jgi:hypothetical protein